MAFKDFTYQYQNFLTESVEKETKTRLQWYTEQKKRGTNKPPKQFEVFKRKIEMLKPDVKQKLPPVSINQYNIKKQTMMPFEKSRTFTDLKEMRPPSPKTQQTLYDGFTKEGKGRAQYLRNRYEIIPENKFIYPVVSSWEYGWRLEDAIKKEQIKKPAYGRTRTVADTFFTRNGIPKADPDSVLA